MDPAQREVAVATITRIELSRNRPAAVAGFDPTFTPTKPVSTLWAVADPGTQQAILDAHRAAVQETLDFAEDAALFTRTGARGCMQVPVRGMLATAFDQVNNQLQPNGHLHDFAQRNYAGWSPPRSVLYRATDTLGRVPKITPFRDPFGLILDKKSEIHLRGATLPLTVGPIVKATKRAKASTPNF